MTLAITPVDPANQADLEAYCQVIEAVRGNDWPQWRQLNPHIIALVLENPFPDNEQIFFVVRRDGEAVAKIDFELSQTENREMAQADIWVVPAARRQGIGTELWQFVQDFARARGRNRIVSNTSWDLPGLPALNQAGIAFAEALDFKPSLVDVTRRLDMSKVDRPVLDAMSKRADGYRVVQWTGESPEEYLPDLAHLEVRLHADAPQGDLELETPTADVDRMRRNQRIQADRGRLRYHSGAIHEATGRLVAWTLITKEKSLDWHAFQQVTVVDPDHRGNRLGALVKAENLNFFRANEPKVTAIDTFNAQTNNFMIAINEEMGYRPLYAWQNWQREI